MRRPKNLGSLIASVAVAGLFLAGWWQRYEVYDWWRLRGYTPPADIVRLATNTTMNNDTRRLFYVYHPELEAKQDFNEDCRDSEQTIVLGCYIPQQGIYMFKVDDKRLQGIIEVTAAHELLHAAYDRLSAQERRRVDGMTSRAFAGLTDRRIKDTVEAYRQKDPSIVANELHSILATEVPQLPADLEAYYKRYFDDRQKIVAYSQAYENEFTSRQNLAAQYLGRIEALKKQIDVRNKQLAATAASLNERYNNLVAERNTADPASYNRQVDQYNAAVTDYNSEVRATGRLIDEYNALIQKYNALALEQNTLLKAIDSRPEVINTQ